MRFPPSFISLIHRRTLLMATTPPPTSPLSSITGGSSERLLNIAQQLRLYKAPASILDDEIEEQRREDAGGKVVSQVGFAESSTPIVGSTERFKPKRAAVLVCLFEDDDGVLRVILTKRSAKLSTHSGEVSLPGGKAEEGDADDVETATREAKEEIGLEPSLVNVVTFLEPFLSKRFVSVTPVIAVLSDRGAFTPAPNPDEVEEIFDAPLEMFLKKENQRSQEREWMGDKYLLHHFDYETENSKFVIWGLTSWILIQVASIVYQRPPDFVQLRSNYLLHSLLASKSST